MDFNKIIVEQRKIDAHSHIGYFGGWSDVGITAEELIDQMNEYNVEKTLISTFPIKDSIEAVDKYPEHFIGVAWVDPNDPKACDTIVDAVENHGFKAIKLHPLFQAFRPTDECVFSIAELARKYDIPLMIHSGHPPHSLPWAIAELADKYPDVKIVMIHMGHGNGIYVQSALDMARKYPNIYLETSGTSMHTKIKETYEKIGHDRIMWGLDAPFHVPAAEILKTALCGLDKAALEDVFYNNVSKLLKL